MKVTVDQESGFCFGVVFAIQMAESELDAGNELYCLGDIVHNNMEVVRLKKKGLKIIDQVNIGFTGLSVYTKGYIYFIEHIDIIIIIVIF